MKKGLDWYKREPIGFLGGVLGLTTKQIAVYTITLDLIYQHGGEIKNAPAWIAGWIDDMGSSSVRKTLLELHGMGKLIVSEVKITQNRAETEAKTKRNQSETRAKAGRKGGKNSAKNRATSNENNDLGQASEPSKTQADKRREEKSKESKKDIPNGISKKDHEIDPPPKQKPKPKKATRLPDDWQPSEQTQNTVTAKIQGAVARLNATDSEKLGVEQGWYRQICENFRNYWLAKSGASATKLNWDLTFLNWVNQEVSKQIPLNLRPKTKDSFNGATQNRPTRLDVLREGLGSLAEIDQQRGIGGENW